MKSKAMFLVLGSMLFLSGCGTKSSLPTEKITVQPNKQTSTNPASNTQQGYLYKSNGVLMFVQWTEADNQMVGQLQIVNATNTNPPNIQNQTHSFKGIHNDSNVSLSFTESAWVDSLGGTNWTGTLKGNELNLNVPQQGGGFTTLVFNQDTIADYNQAISDLQQGIQQAQSQAQQQQAQAKQVADQQAAVSNANDKLGRTINALNSDITSLLNSTNSLGNVFPNYAKHLQDMKDHYAKLKSDAAVQPFDTYALGDVKYDLGDMKYDLGDVQYDDGDLKYSKDDINGYINSINADIDSINKSWQQLQNAVSANSSGAPSAQFTNDDIQSSTAKAQAQIKASTTALQKAQSQADSYDQQVNQLYQTVSQYVDSLKATN